ncbi:MAG TPA: PPOX class F420-dependent oxidoreductase [Anaerolineaceae bacterium]|jgi:pyridoxamine 5'-phosphate oxidase family protein
MSVFTPQEIEYLQTQRLGRLATIDPEGNPQNSPVGFRYNAALDTIDIGGRAMSKTKKFRNIQKNSRVAFVVDDVLPPWQPRCIEIRGTAQALPTGGKELYGSNYPMDEGVIRISATQIISWGMGIGGESQSMPGRSNRRVTRAADLQGS